MVRAAGIRYLGMPCTSNRRRGPGGAGAPGCWRRARWRLFRPGRPSDTGTKATAAAPRSKFEPGRRAVRRDVLPTAPVSVEVRDGWFQQRGADQPVGQGASRARSTGTAPSTPITEPLGYDATYTWSGSAVGHDGKAVPVSGKFTTVDPDQVDRRRIPARRRPDGRRRGADHPAVRRADQPTRPPSSGR